MRQAARLRADGTGAIDAVAIASVRAPRPAQSAGSWTVAAHHSVMVSVVPVQLRREGAQATAVAGPLSTWPAVLYCEP